MKRLTLFVALFMLGHLVFAGGILTNTNQSAQFVRMLSRNASTQIDAVYFNPAGIIKLENGWHFALHNQSIFQNRTIESGYPYLNNKTYEGKVTAPLFPDVFAVYKKEKLALSFMVGPVGGGGGAKYDTGLPSFEKNISSLVPGLAGLSSLGYSVAGYNVGISFEGTSVFWGIQGGVTYSLSDAISVYGGVRYMPSKNTYQGAINDISLTVNGNDVKAKTFLSGVSTTLNAYANNAYTAASNLTGLISAGAGSLTLAQLEGAGYIDATTRATIEGGLRGLGVPQTQINVMNVQQIQGGFTAGGDALSQQSATLGATATLMDNKEVDTQQTGAGITPILGVNLSPAEGLNIGIKYEFKTFMTLTNETTKDDTGLFPDKAKSGSDIPAILAIGADYKFSDKLNVQLSYNTYFDKNVDWGNNVYQQKRTIDNNYWEIALGAQYAISDNFAISAGVMHSNTGVSEDYQSDFSYSNDSYSGGLGFEWKLSKKLTFDAGAMMTKYIDYEKSFDGYKETYGKSNVLFALGLSYSIF